MGEIHEFILGRVYEDVSVAAGGISWQAREIVLTHDYGACPQCTVNPEHGCETIRLLAQAWSDHPDYRADWNSFHDGDFQIRPSRATEILEELSHPDRPSVVKSVVTLTDREIEVLLLIAEGVSYRDIANQLFISPHTVKNHARNCVEKSHLLHRHGGTGEDRGAGMRDGLPLNMHLLAHGIRLAPRRRIGAGEATALRLPAHRHVRTRGQRQIRASVAALNAACAGVSGATRLRCASR
jgi:DNA-binding CsgD family transcriptional regulator